jgi:hypothetical protein
MWLFLCCSFLQLAIVTSRRQSGMSQRKRSHGGDVRDARRDQPALMRPLEVPVQRKEIRTSVYRKAYRPIDMSLPMRERTCPLLLRVFVSMGHHNDLSAYDIATGLTPTQELPVRRRSLDLVPFRNSSHWFRAAHRLSPVTLPSQIYTWKDATLRELTGLIQSVIPEARASGAQCSFSLVYPGQTGHYTMRHVGVVSATGAGTDSQTLEQLRVRS